MLGYKKMKINSFKMILSLAFLFYCKPDLIKRSNKHSAKHWGYRNEDRSLLPINWHRTHSKCSGDKQSPINIDSCTTLLDKRLKLIKIESNSRYRNNEKQIWSIFNNGHSGKLKKFVILS